MTSQPPPPPPPARRPAAGQFDPKSVNPLDWAILGIGAIVFIFSFFGYYSFSSRFGDIEVSASFSGWHFDGRTFIGWFAMVLAVLAAIALAVQLFAPTVSLPAPARVLGLGLFAVSFLLYIIGLFAMSIPFGNHGFSYWIGLILAAGGLVLSLMRVQQTGEQLPGALAGLPNIGAYGPKTPSAQTPHVQPPPAAPPFEPPTAAP